MCVCVCVCVCALVSYLIYMQPTGLVSEVSCRDVASKSAAYACRQVHARMRLSRRVVLTHNVSSQIRKRLAGNGLVDGFDAEYVGVALESLTRAKRCLSVFVPLY